MARSQDLFTGWTEESRKVQCTYQFQFRRIGAKKDMYTSPGSSLEWPNRN